MTLSVTQAPAAESVRQVELSDGVGLRSGIVIGEMEGFRAQTGPTGRDTRGAGRRDNARFRLRAAGETSPHLLMGEGGLLRPR